jgi:hypothetical protein
VTPERLTAELMARLDGPHADEHTAAAAELVSAAVRFLNYATGTHSAQGVSWPSTVYAVTARLSEAAGRMPQLCHQLASWLDAGLDAGHLGVDDRSDPVGPVEEATSALVDAAGLAARLSIALANAQSALGSVNARGTAR